MNKLLKNVLSSVMGLAMVANIAVVPVLADEATPEPTSTSEITVYENYNHKRQKNEYISANVAEIETSSNPNNTRMTISNYDLPSIDASKLVSVKYELTSKKAGKAVALYAGANEQRQTVYSLYSRIGGNWGSSWEEYTSQLTKTIDSFANVYTSMTNNGIMATTEAVSAADVTVSIESDNFTSFVKEQIENNKESINLALDGYWEGATFYSSTTSGKEPKLVFVVDDSAADTELATLTANNFKKFVNTYASYYNIDAGLINEYGGAAINAIYNKLTKLDNWNTKAGFKAAYEAAANLTVNEVNANYAGSMYFNGNATTRQIDLNTSAMWFIANNSRKGIVGFDMPNVNLNSVKSVKLNGKFKRQTAGSANLYAFENLDSSKFSSGTTQENFDNMEKLLIKDIKPVGYSSTLVFTTTNQEEKEIDVTDFVKESIKSGTENIFFTFEDTNDGIQIVNPSTMQLVFEIENESVKDEFSAISTAEALNAFILNDEKASAVGIDNSEYKKMYAPMYVAEKIMSIGYTDVESLNTAIKTAINKSLVEKKLDITSAYTKQTQTNTYTDVTNLTKQGLYLNCLYINLASLKNVDLIRDIDLSLYASGSEDQSTSLAGYYVNDKLNTSDISKNYETMTGEFSGMRLLPNNTTQTFNLKSVLNSLNEDCTLSVQICNTGNVTVALNGATANQKPYFTVKYDTTKALADFAAMDTQEEVDTFLKNDANCAALGIDNTNYLNFAYPEYVAGAIAEEGFENVEGFKTAFDNAMAKYIVKKEIKASNVAYYKTTENDVNPMSQGFKAYTTNATPANGIVWLQYDLSNINETVFSGTMCNVRADKSTNIRTQKILKYTNVAAPMPTKGTGTGVDKNGKTDGTLWSLESPEAVAFNIWQTNEDNFKAPNGIVDGTTQFKFDIKSENEEKYDTNSSALNVDKNLINAINNGADTTDELWIEVGKGENIYTYGITFELLVDGTVAAYEKDARIDALMSALYGPSTAEDMQAMLEAYSDVLELSENIAYKKATDKKAIAQAVLDGRNSITSVDDIKAIINTEAAKYQPTKLMEITKVSYINEPNYDLDGDGENEGTGYLGTAYVKKYDDLNSTEAKLVAAVYDKATGVLLGVKSVDAYDKLNKANYGDTVEINIGAYFVMGNNTTPNTEIKVFVWDTSEGNKALADVFKMDAVTNITTNN